MDDSSDEAEPMFNDASLSASLDATSIGELHDALYDANDEIMNPAGVNRFYKLPTEIKFKIIELCMPNRDAWRSFEICRAPKNLIYLNEKERTHDTQILSVSRVFRDIYLKQLPIMLPSFTNKPIYIHQNTTVVLDMSEQEFYDLTQCSKWRSQTFLSQIRHLAIPLLLFGNPPD